MNLEELVLDFFEFVGNIDFNIFSTLLGLILVIFWFVIIGWVWIDSGERTSKKGLRAAYIILVLVLNIPGLIIYLIVRPSETIEEIYWADLERRYLKYETSDLGDCVKCGHQLFPGYVFCTNCGNEIKKRCPKCGVIINKEHKYCEHCGTQVRERALEQEKYPDVAVMEQQIIATKEHAVETVESKRTKYKTGHSFVVKLGQAILSLFRKVKTHVDTKIEIVEAKKEEAKPIQKEQNKQKGQKQSKKNKKKKKRK